VKEIEPDRLVFVDESGATTEMTRRYGRAPCGERVREATPAGHWSTLPLLGAMSREGMVASMTVESPTDGDVFLAYLDHVLCPALRPGQVVVMDNLSAPKVEGVRERIEAAGAQLLYLPPYSPDFNPIEQAWSKLKRASAFGQIADGRRAAGDHSAGPPNDHGTKRLGVVFPLWIRSTLIVKML